MSHNHYTAFWNLCQWFSKEKSDLFLSIFLYELCDKKYQRYINKSILLSLIDFLKSDKPNLSKNVKDNYYIIKNYDKIEFNYINENEFRYDRQKIQGNDSYRQKQLRIHHRHPRRK